MSPWRPRQRPLLRLSDQGAARPVPAALFGLGGRDRSWNPYADNFLRANRSQLEALEIQTELAPGADGIALLLRPGGVIGAVPLRAPDSHKVAAGVVVQPRFGWDGVGPVLSRTGWAATPTILDQPLVPGSAREVPPWVLAGPILRRFGRLLRELGRGFRMHEDVRQVPRGQILWRRYATEQMARGAFHRLPCRFPELGPDLLLRSYLRWGLERVRRSLAPHGSADVVARRLVEQADVMIAEVEDAAARFPDRRGLDQLLRGVGLPTDALHGGLEALGWLVDERGLAGLAETDGLSWSLPMHELFELWVEHLASQWARSCGGVVASARTGTTVSPIQWTHPGAGSLGSLVPDVVVTIADSVFIFDAKYKGHFEELDEQRWAEVGEQLRAEHRHDVHQVLAYAALFEAPQVVSVLVYPMRLAAWRRLADRGGAAVTASLTSGGRRLGLALAGVPIELPLDRSTDDVLRAWEPIRDWGSI